MKTHLISFALGALTFMCVGCKKEDYKIEKPLVIVDNYSYRIGDTIK